MSARFASHSEQDIAQVALTFNYILYNKTLIYLDLGKAMCFVVCLLLLLSSPWATTAVSGHKTYC